MGVHLITFMPGAQAVGSPTSAANQGRNGEMRGVGAARMQVRDGQAGPFWSSYPRQLGAGPGEGPKQFNKEAAQAPRLRPVTVGPQLGLCPGRAGSMGQAES